jgi:hypothetical protein
MGPATFAGSTPPAATPATVAPLTHENAGRQLADTLAPELHKLKGLAVGTALSLIREIFCTSLPEPIRPQLDEIVDRMIEKLGGEPIPPQAMQQMLAHDENRANGKCASESR